MENGVPLSIALAAPVFVSAVGWFITYYMWRQGLRSTLTIQLIMAVHESEGLQEAAEFMADRIHKNKPIGGDIIQKGVPDSSRDKVLEREHRYVIRLLNYYEFMGTMLRKGQLDAQVVINFRRGGFSDTWKICEKYILAARDSLNREDLYSGFQWFVETYPRQNRKVS